MNTMGSFIKLYLATIPVFFALDMAWLGLVARRFYKSRLGALLRPEVNWPAALAFYFIYIAGILVFAVLPNLDDGSLARTVRQGALFGFFTYATYDLTNLATLANWPLSVTMVDMAWGTLLCAGVSASAYGLGRWLC